MTHYTFKTPRHYKKSLVAYLDIMGFKKKVEKSSRFPEEADAVYQLLQAHHLTTQIINKGKDAPYPELIKLKATLFSDNIVITLPIMNDKTFRSFVHVVTRFQWDTIDFSSFLRGAIVYGPVCHTKELVFGPAMVRAYEMERKDAKWPRVIVSPDLIPLLSEETRQFAFTYMLSKDENGTLFVDYLRYIYLCKLGDKTDDTNEPPSFLPDEFVFRQHRHSIEEALNDRLLTSHVLSPLYQAVVYHNYSIDKICRELTDGYYPSLDEKSKERHIEILQSEKVNLDDAFWRYPKFLQRHKPKPPEVTAL